MPSLQCILLDACCHHFLILFTYTSCPYKLNRWLMGYIGRGRDANASIHFAGCLLSVLPYPFYLYKLNWWLMTTFSLKFSTIWSAHIVDIIWIYWQRKRCQCYTTYWQEQKQVRWCLVAFCQSFLIHMFSLSVYKSNKGIYRQRFIHITEVYTITLTGHSESWKFALVETLDFWSPWSPDCFSQHQSFVLDIVVVTQNLDFQKVCSRRDFGLPDTAITRLLFSALMIVLLSLSLSFSLRIWTFWKLTLEETLASQ